MAVKSPIPPSLFSSRTAQGMALALVWVQISTLVVTVTIRDTVVTLLGYTVSAGNRTP